MDVDDSNVGTSNWKDIAIVFKMKTDDRTHNGRMLELNKYFKDTTGVSALHFGQLRKSSVIAFLSDAETAKKCREKIESGRTNGSVDGNDTLHSWIFDTRWIQIGSKRSKTTKEDIVAHIKKHGKTKITQNDIYLRRSDVDPSKGVVANIECSSNEKARELVKALSQKKLNDEPTWVQLGNVPKGKTRSLTIGNLDESVTAQDVADYLKTRGKVRNKPKGIMIRSEGTKDKKSVTAKIEFKSEKEADDVAGNLNGSKLKGREVAIQWIAEWQSKLWEARVSTRGGRGKVKSLLKKVMEGRRVRLIGPTGSKKGGRGKVRGRGRGRGKGWIPDTR